MPSYTPHPSNVPNPSYLANDKRHDTIIQNLEDNVKYSFYITDKETAKTPHVPVQSVPRVNLATSGANVESFNPTISQNIETTDNKQVLVDNHNEILKLRAQLDQQLQELYTLNNSLSVENKIAYDTTIYTGLMWTILATSIIYFVFVKI